MSVRCTDHHSIFCQFQSVLQLIDDPKLQIIRDSQSIDGEDNDCVLISGSDRQSFGKEGLPDAFGFFCSATKTIQTNGGVGRDIDRSHSCLIDMALLSEGLSVEAGECQQEEKQNRIRRLHWRVSCGF